MSVAKGFRLSDDSTASLDWNYVTKPDGSKSIIEEVNDVKEDLAELQGGGMSDDAKQALLACFDNVGWKNGDGSEFIDALESALFPPADLVSISAVYTQSSTVYNTDSLNSLKADLVVTAHYSNGSAHEVTSYVLSGTLVAGTSTIAVSYGGKSTTFNVVVTESSAEYVTDGLFAFWDSIDNQATGEHDANATTWKDTINGYEWTAMKTDGTQTWSWNSNALVFNPTETGSASSGGKNTFSLARSNTGVRTLEIVLTPDSLTGCVGEFSDNKTGLTNSTAQVVGLITSDNSFIIQGSQTGYSAGNITNIKSISGVYDSSYSPQKAYMNGEEVTTRVNSHSFQAYLSGNMILGTQNNGTNQVYAYKGKIHAIRFYNRELTAEEIANNYSIDVIRYGLGA